MYMTVSSIFNDGVLITVLTMF